MIGKRVGLMLSSFVSFIGLISLASALDVRTITDSVINFYKDVFGPIFAALFGQYSTDEFLFAKILVFLLLVILINFILKKSKMLGDKKGLIFMISLIVSILSIRFLPDNDLINGILLPYGVLGVALVTFLPFLIYFFFVHESVPTGFGRRSAWAVYAIVFVVLLGFRWDQISPASEWIYITGIILVILAFMFDRTIHEYFALHETSKWIESIRRGSRNDLRIKLSKLYEIQGMHPEVKKQIADLEAQLASFK